ASAPTVASPSRPPTPAPEVTTAAPNEVEADFDLASEPLVPEAEDEFEVEVEAPQVSRPPPPPNASRPPPPPSLRAGEGGPSQPPFASPPSSTPLPAMSMPPGRSPDETQPETAENVKLASLPSLFDVADEIPSVPPSVSDVASLRPAARAAEAARGTLPGAAPQRAAYPELTPAGAESVLEARAVPPRKSGPMVAVAGAVLLFVAAGAAGGWWYLTQREGMSPPSPQVSPVRVVPTPARPDVVVAAAVVDAAVVTDRSDVPTTPLDAPSAADVPTLDAPARADVAPDVVHAADVAVVAVAVDGGAATPTPTPTPNAAGEAPPVITREPMRGHPRNRESRALEDAMYDEVIRCAAGTHRRRVRVAVRYLGTTGRAEEIHVGAPFNEGTVAACIEGVVRRHPVGRFTSEDWETYFIFDPDD
ncbi:MAG: hypothetical protein U0325_29840, partial [Polyangiales bacterium]